MNGRNSIVPSRATSNGVASSRMTATSGIASRLTCVPNWLMVSAVHSRTKSRVAAARWPEGRSRPAVYRAILRAHVGRLVAVSRGVSIDACSSSPSRTCPRGGGSTSSTGWPRRSSRCRSVHLLDRTSDASHNRSVFTMAGEDGPVTRGARAARRGRDPRDRHGRPQRRAPAHRGRRRHPVRAARRHDDGRLRRARPGVRRSGSRPGSSCRSTCTRKAALRPDRVKLADVRRGQYEGLQGGDRPARPRAGLRAWRGCTRRPARSPSARGRSSSPTTSTSSRRTSTWPSGSPGASASQAAASRRSRPTASGSRSCAGRRCR